MLKEALITPIKWLAGGIIIILMVTLTAFQVSPACHDTPKCHHTPTPTPTLTPTPTPKACQVAGIIFGKESYTVGDTIRVTVRLVDHRGMPLGRATVTAQVNREDASAQASTGFILVDRAGEYDGDYPTQKPGLYHFNITAADPTQQLFASCQNQAVIEVKLPPEQCRITTVFDKKEYKLGETITLTASVTPCNQPQYCPEVTGVVARPDNLTDLIGFNGSCPAIGIYHGANIQGFYTFTVSARDLKERFRPCSASTTVKVIPTTTTATVKVVPESLKTTCCRNWRETTSIDVKDVSNLVKAELVITYSDIIRVIQVRPGDVFPTANIITDAGRISFVAERQDPFNGAGELLEIEWNPQQVGNGSISPTVILTGSDGQMIKTEVQSGWIDIKPCRQVNGAAMLQGRSDHSRIIVTNAAGEQARTRADGSFAIAGDKLITFTFPGYLPAQVELKEILTAEQVDGEEIHLDAITLLAGDVNSDNVVNIFDLALVAANYATANPTADLNADGVVDIFDLALVAGNYQQQGGLSPLGNK